MKRFILLGLGLGTLAACGHPTTLQYDHGRAYHETFTMQADLERESAADAEFPLTGEEAAAIRMRVVEETTDAEDARSTFKTETN